jgi:hypothetical protein
VLTLKANDLGSCPYVFCFKDVQRLAAKANVPAAITIRVCQHQVGLEDRLFITEKLCNPATEPVANRFCTNSQIVVPTMPWNQQTRI